MQAGDLVRIKGMGSLRFESTWPEANGQIGVIVSEAKRLYIPAAKVMVLGEVVEFDHDELEVISESW